MELKDIQVGMVASLGRHKVEVKRIIRERINVEILDPDYNATNEQAPKRRQVRAFQLTKWEPKKP